MYFYSAHKDISAVLEDYPISKATTELIPKLSGQLPLKIKFTDDTWNIISWKNRKGNSRYSNLSFSDFNNKELKELVKIFILHRRLAYNISPHAAYNYVYSIKFLDKCIFHKPMNDLVNVDFKQTEKLIKSSSGAAARLCHFLFCFGEWLNLRIGLPISYSPKIREVYKHGRRSTEEGREKKLINTLIIRDMVEMNTRQDLSDKDRFFLSVFVIFVATGFRINELATLPKNSFEERDGSYSFRYFGEKVRKLEVRPVPTDMVPAVKAAYEHILRITEPGREIVKRLRDKLTFDWKAIFEDAEATDYFLRKWANEWTAAPRNQMLNPNGVWLEKEKRVIDIISIVEQAGSKSAAARQLGVTRTTVDGLLVAQHNARQGLLPCTIASGGKDGRTDWDTDARVISIPKFLKHCGIEVSHIYRDAFRPVIDKARDLQLKGEVFPEQPIRLNFDMKYMRTIRPVVEGYKGKPLLEPEDALFVIPRYIFSGARSTMVDDYRLISDKAISRWFTGEARSYGTGNHEDSCFSRLGIIDPATEDIAKFSSHDIRHWLDTIYAEGHVDEETIALIFSRKPGSNHVYDQTSKKQRLENIRQSVRDGKVMGFVSENYSRLAQFSRLDAENYLLAATRMVNIMPHGACTLSWGMQACPNHMSCFSGNSGCCEHFSIDLNDAEQLDEIKRMEREVAATLDYMLEESPQFSHYTRIKQNLDNLLASC